MTMARIYSLFGVVLLWATAAHTAPERDLIEQRRLYLEARNALAANNAKTYQAAIKKLDDYPLLGYLHYEELNRRLAQAKPNEVRGFLTRNADSPIAARLRSTWLTQLAQTQQWKTFRAFYEPQPDEELRCHDLTARLKTGKLTAELAADIQRAWLVAHEPPAACDPAFDAWIKAKKVTADLAWQRIRLAMESGKISVAQGLRRHLRAKDREWVDLWVRVHENPGVALDDKLLAADSALAREIVRHGVMRMMRIDIDTTLQRWAELRAKYTFEPATIANVERELALQAAYRQHPRALELLTARNATDEQAVQWRARAALAQADWSALRDIVTTLPVSEPDKDLWLYWRGRAMSELGAARDEPSYNGVAFDAFDSVASRRSFYGFLAADRLTRDYDFNHNPTTYDTAALETLAALPGMRRAYELLFLDRIVDARKEWLLATARFDPRQLQLASVLAHHWGWHDRAILTSAQGAEFDDLDLRFPTVYRDQVEAAARKYGLDPAWVYGIMRQESAFMHDARSNKGATGLMQLMPATASLTARLLKSPMKSNHELLDIDRNIDLGSAYLKQMADQHGGNIVLASAAYNAGPQRVKQWRPRADMPADMWIELMPYKETREYVKRVLTYTTIFDDRLNGRATRITDRMPAISP